MPYIFVAATVISVFVVVFLYKRTVGKIVEGSDSLFSIQKGFFLWIGLGEVIPILLIVFGFMKMDQIAEAEVGFIPLLLVALVVGIGGLAIFLQRSFSGGAGDDPEKMVQIRLLALISLGLMSSVPIVSIISLLLMMMQGV